MGWGGSPRERTRMDMGWAIVFDVLEGLTRVAHFPLSHSPL